MTLTARQRQIVVLVAQGLQNQEIADQLCLSVSTVEHHLDWLFGTLNARNRAHLVDLAWRAGILGLVLVGSR